MYEKRNWKARKGTGLNKFTKSEESGNTVVLTNTPDSISEPGTSFVPENMNHMEQGISDAHDAITTETKERERQIANESQERQTADQNLQGQIENEIHNRAQGDVDALNAAKNYTDQTAAELSAVLDGAQAITLSGALLTRVIIGTTPVAKNLFDPATIFVADKTLISDINGTIGVFRYSLDSAIIIVETLSVSPMSANEPTLLGNVSSHAGLPLTVEDATAKGWNTPRLDDYATVLNDENLDNQRAEWYIRAIDTDGNITWGDPVIINTGDYQAQTTAQDAGKVLTGGRTPGTHGESLSVDSEPTENSQNLVSSHGIFAFVQRLIQTVLNAVFLLSHPIGSIYMTANANENTATAMNTKYGGTWVAWGQGRVPVSVNTSGTFNTLEKTGGTETVALTDVSQIPSHDHTGPSHNHTFTGTAHTHAAHTGNIKGIGAGGMPLRVDNTTDVDGVFSLLSNIPAAVGILQKASSLGSGIEGIKLNATHDSVVTGGSIGYAGTGNTGPAGSGNAHNNLQPYITCFMYKRTA
jgi:microcystin-dependent protein